MKVLLWWMEPIEVIPPQRRGQLFNRIFCFGIAAVVGLGIVAQSGPTKLIAVGNGSELSVPSQAWQYGLWLLIVIGVGWFGSWIVSYGGRAEVTMRDDGIQWLLGKATRRFYAYAQMERCELERADDGNYWRLRMSMRPVRPGDPAYVGATAIPKHIDVDRVRGILRMFGVATTG
jgi:hypothetical protein